MAYVIALIRRDARGWPRVGDTVYLAAELPTKPEQPRRYLGHAWPFRQVPSRAHREVLWGDLGGRWNGAQRYAMGTGRIVPLKKVAHRNARLDADLQLMRVMIEGSVTAALDRALTTEEILDSTAHPLDRA